MRILQIGKYYPPVKGGMESVLRDLCEGLLEAGHEVTALVASSDGQRRSETIAGVHGALIRCAAAGVVASQPLTLGLLHELRVVIDTWRPDIVQIHLPNPLAAACLMLARSRLPVGTPVTVWHHADVARQRLGRWFVRPLSRRLLASCDGICVSSDQLRDTSEELAPVRPKATVIPFGIDPDRWTVGDPAGTEDFLFVGRLVYYKGLDLLLDAASLEPRARIRIVGDGPLRTSLERRVADEGLTDRVEFLGQRSDDEVRSLMAGSRALLLPSAHGSETFGVVQLEAMASGVPVVSTRLATGVVAVNQHEETGLVVRPGDAADLATALTRLLDEPGQAARWGQAGLARVRDRHHRRGMIAAVAAWYQDLLTASRGD